MSALDRATVRESIAEAVRAGYVFQVGQHGKGAAIVSDITGRVWQVLEATLLAELDSTYCAYCDAVFSVDAPDAKQAVGDHIETCEHHPMRALRERIAALEAALAYYADRMIYVDPYYTTKRHGKSPVLVDGGEIARALLGKE